MNWENLNYDEITFFCKSPKANIEFDCLPNLQTMVVQLLDMLQYYHIKSFTTDDMQKIFEILQIKSGRTGKLILPSAKKMQITLEKLCGTFIFREGEKFVIDKEKGELFGIYEQVIRRAYEKGDI